MERTRINLWIPKWLYEWLDAQAGYEGRSLSDLVREGLMDLKEKKGEPDGGNQRRSE